MSIGITGFIAIARLIISLIPMTMELIKAIEEAIPGRGKGEEKLGLVRDVLEEMFEPVQGVVDTFEALWTKMSPVIGIIVKRFNNTGTFEK